MTNHFAGLGWQRLSKTEHVRCLDLVAADPGDKLRSHPDLSNWAHSSGRDHGTAWDGRYPLLGESIADNNSRSSRASSFVDAFGVGRHVFRIATTNDGCLMTHALWPAIITGAAALCIIDMGCFFWLRSNVSLFERQLVHLEPAARPTQGAAAAGGLLRFSGRLPLAHSGLSFRRPGFSGRHKRERAARESTEDGATCQGETKVVAWGSGARTLAAVEVSLSIA